MEDNELKIGKVIYYDKTYILKQLPNVDIGYWSTHVNLFTEEGLWNHVAHISTLKNIE